MHHGDIRRFKVACLQAAATLLAGLAAHNAGGPSPYFVNDDAATGKAAATCANLAKELFKEATGEAWPT